MKTKAMKQLRKIFSRTRGSGEYSRCRREDLAMEVWGTK